MVTTIGARTPLHIAASEGAVYVTQVLLSAGGVNKTSETVHMYT